MTKVLSFLAWQLSGAIARAGFILTDLGESDGGVNDRMQQLEYRAELSERRFVLLDICELTTPRMITATLWSPDDLVQARAESSVDAVAIHRRSWKYDSSTDPTVLASKITSELDGWLASRDRPSIH